MQYSFTISSGTLHLDTRHESVPLESLLGFAARENRKRSFHFVSRVLGKHLPCRPSVVRRSCVALARRVACERGEKTLVVGLGEAATGLGGGVAEVLAARVGVGNLLYMFSSRERPGAAPLLGFDEIHSHAPNHLLFAPHERHACLFRAAEHLLLVDDEITTGRTITLLAGKLARELPSLRRITFLSLVSWLSEARERALTSSLPGVEVRFAQLLAGGFRFEPNPDYRVDLPTKVDRGTGPCPARSGTGRDGVMMDGSGAEFVPEQLAGDLPRERALLVLGNGEFMYQPLLLAERLEAQGWDVLFSSTTRTPIGIGDVVRERLEFPSRRTKPDGPVHYLYNLPRDRMIISCYEHPRDAAEHGLGELVPCRRVVLPAGLGLGVDNAA